MKKIYLLLILICFATLYAESQNLISNPDFETGSLTPGWNTWNNGIVTGDNVYAGTYSGVINAGKSGSVKQTIALLPSTNYTAKVWARVSNEGESASFMAVENDVSIPIKSQTYKEYTFQFETTPEQTLVDISVYKETESFGNVYVDNFSLTTDVGIVGNEFFVDAINGNDANDGRSENSAWKTLSKVNGITFVPGNRVLFKAGCQWNGQLEIHSSGIPGAPIVYTRYGTGPKPQINGNGGKRYTVRAMNAAYTEISEFDITNTGTTAEGGRLGVLLLANNTGDIFQTVIKNLDIHHVNGSSDKNEGGGVAIKWESTGTTPSRLVEMVIEGCTIYNCQRDGIKGIAESGDRYLHLRPHIKGNTIYNIPGDGIVIRGCKDALAEYNVCRDFTDDLPNVPKNAAAGIWAFNSDNTIIQHNEVSGHKSAWDAQGFDADWNCNGTIIQYNYSHDNAGGFVLICCNGKWSGYNNSPIVRYNISINDGYRTWGTGADYAPSIHIAGPVSDAKIYNNSIYTKEKPASVEKTYIDYTNWSGWSDNTFVANNIFSAVEQMDFKLGNSTNNTFMYNLYHNAVWKPGNNWLTGDPGFVNMGGITPDDYQLTASSQALGAGFVVSNNGGRDFFNNPVSATQAPNIGAYNGPGVNNLTSMTSVDSGIADPIFNIINPILSNELHININGTIENATVRIHSLSGKTLQAKSYNTLSGVVDIELGHYRGGLYLVSIETGTSKQTMKLIKR